MAQGPIGRVLFGKDVNVPKIIYKIRNISFIFNFFSNSSKQIENIYTASEKWTN